MISSIGRCFSSVLFGFLALFKRALCFLSRKRRNSGAILPTHVKSTEVDIPNQVLSDNFQFPATENHSDGFQFPVQPENHVAQIQANEEGESLAEDSLMEWDTWDKTPSSQQTAGDSRQQGYSSKQPPPEPEPEPDYFSDLGLAPTIKKQKKVLVKSAVTPAHHQPERSNRLAFAPEMAAPLSAELEEWDESAGAWEDEDVTLEAEQAMRQTRKAEREKRIAEHQRRNQEKEQRKSSKDSTRLAAKLS